MEASESSWGVLTTQPSAEKRALWHLAVQGYAAYAPREKVTRTRRGQKITESRWLFPRYIFVALRDTWYSLTSTIGVAQVVMAGERPARLPKGWVESMKARERNGLITLPPAPRFRSGQTVTVTSGPFAGIKGLYSGMTSRQREVVILDALGRVELASGLLR